MKAIVINAFYDKNTGEPYNAGSTYESTDKERIKELREGGYLQATPGEAEKNTDKDAETKTGDQQDNQGKQSSEEPK